MTYDSDDAEVDVIVLDTETGETAKSDYRFSPFWWSDGNGSCDCNRRSLFPAPRTGCAELNEEFETGICLGCHRYLIVSVDPMPSGYTLADFNDEYPPDLVAKHIPQPNPEIPLVISPPLL